MTDSIFSEAWKNWIEENVAAGRSKDQLFKILVDSGFPKAAIAKELDHTPTKPLEQIQNPLQKNKEQTQYFDEKWQNWISENLAKGCSKEHICRILHEHGFDSDAISLRLDYKEATEFVSGPKTPAQIKAAKIHIPQADAGVPTANTPRIFVAIASYRDSECEKTINDLFAKAKRPGRITAGVCNQIRLPGDESLVLLTQSQLKVIQFDISETKGASWAKKQALDFWSGEEYVLLIDSHMRFADHWDQRMIKMLDECPSSKPILTSYPAQYEPPDKLEFSTPHMVAKEFDERSKILRFRSWRMTLDKPKPSAFIAGGFIFARSDLFQQVPYDENIYFYGEEVMFSVRAWTWGWDAFTPHECLIHHYYTREESPKHWGDHKNWWCLNQESLKRVHHLLRIEENPALGILEEELWGTERSIDEYEKYAGVNFKSQSISDKALKGEFPANQ